MTRTLASAKAAVRTFTAKVTSVVRVTELAPAIRAAA
jgi:hypothetical protein